MEFEPNIPLSRESEALVIAVDSFTAQNEASIFESLRDAAMRMARTRLIYSMLKDDLIAVVKSGSADTNNALADANPEGYEGIELLLPPVSKSLTAVKILAELTPGNKPSHLLDLLDVCGDTLSLPAVDRAKTKRLVLFTGGTESCKAVPPEYHDDFEATCELYKQHGMQVDIICFCDEELVEPLEQLEEELEDQGELSAKQWMSKTAGHQLSFLFSLCKVTGGALMSFREASPLVDRPTPKVKRAMAKYRGTLNIADIIKIPIKRFSFVSEIKHHTGKKLSWDASTKRKENVPVGIETQRVASAKDDSPLEAAEIVNAYPYGPELVPEQNEVDTYAWSIHLPRGLDVLGFVAQSSVPTNLFMGHVDVVIAMPGVYGAGRLMKCLVLALQAESVGILARSVTAAKGGAPHLVFLWPRVEICKESGGLKNFFLFMVEIPMREDVRHLPFASLEDTTSELPQNATSAMDRYICAALINSAEEGPDIEGSEEDEEDEAFWPPKVSNPNLDWFNICIVHRALGGISAADFPPFSTWHQNLMDPASVVKKRNKDEFSQSIRDLKSTLPVIPAKRKDKKGRRVHQAVNGDLSSFLSYLPRDVGDDGEASGHEEEVIGGETGGHLDYDEALSSQTDFEVGDVSEQNPVADFKELVKRDKFNFAAASLLVVVRRLIRDVVDDDKAMQCLRALRQASLEKKEPRFFNDFISSAVSRCNRRDVVGNRTAAFFRFVGKRGEIASVIDIIPLSVEEFGAVETAGDRAHREFLEEISEKAKQLASEKSRELSTSALSKE